MSEFRPKAKMQQKFDFGCGSGVMHQTPLGKLTALLRSLAGIKGNYFF